jgi:DNA modification methylase
MSNTQQKLEHIATALLIPYARNSRTHSENQIKQVANSITEFGFTNPVLIDSDNGIIAGHGRVMAAQLLCLDSVPCLRLGHYSEAPKRAYIIADNQLALNADWDEDMLRAELLDLQGIEFDMDLLGFDVETLEDLLFIEPERDDSKEDEVPEPPVDPVSKLGDVWLLGKHRVMNGDSTRIDDVEKLIDGKKADIVFSDPPYGIDVVNDNGKVGGGTAKYPTTVFSKIIGDSTTDKAKEFYSACIAMGFDKFIIFGGNYFTDFLKPNRCWVVWFKNHVTERTFANCELAWTNIDHNSKTYSSTWDGYTKEGESGSKIHPSQKPIKLCADVLQDFTEVNDIIYDGFLGSGSTLIAAEKTNRICYGIELSPAYVDVIVNRWQTYTNQQATLEATGQTFDACRDAKSCVSTDNGNG